MTYARSLHQTDAREQTLILEGSWHGRYGTAACPVCQRDRRKGQNALTIKDGRNGLMLNCKKGGCSFTSLLAALGLRIGERWRPDEAVNAEREFVQRQEAQRKAELARRLWREAQPVAGTLAEVYLRQARLITCPLPASLRFHGAVWHSGTKRHWPAMIAVVQGSGAAAVHRTYLREDGLGKAPIEPAKAMLGATTGGAVRLATGPSRLVVVEGIETGLSLCCGLLSEAATVWAALSTSGVRGLRLPDQIGQLVVAPDGDDPGRAAATALAERAHGLGWQVSILDPGTGHDFNDILMKGAEE